MKNILLPVATFTALLIAAQHGIALANTEAATIKGQADDNAKLSADNADLHTKLDAAGASITQLQTEIATLKDEDGEAPDADTQTAIDGVIAADPAPAPTPAPEAQPAPGDGNAGSPAPQGGSGVAMSNDTPA